MLRHLSQFRHPDHFGLPKKEYKKQYEAKHFDDFFETGFLYSQNKLQEITGELKPGEYNFNLTFPIFRSENGIYACVNLLEDAEKAPEHLKGRFGRVVFVQNLLTGEWFAGKEQLLPFENKESSETKNSRLDEISSEKEHQKLSALGKCDPKLFNYQKKHNTYNFTVMELAKGIGLFELITDSQKKSTSVYHWPPLLWLRIILGTLKEVHQLHLKKFIHLDIKLENILFDIITGSVSVIDFGLADKIDEDTGIAKSSLKKGTSEYIDPKTKKDQGDYLYKPANDVYALGILILELLHKTIVKDGRFTESRDRRRNLLIEDEELMNFVDSLRNNIETRPDLPSAIQFFEKYIDKYTKEHPDEDVLINRITQNAIEAENKQIQPIAESYVKNTLASIKEKTTTLKTLNGKPISNYDKINNIGFLKADIAKANQHAHLTRVFNKACRDYYQHKNKYGSTLGCIRRYFFTSTETLQVINHIRLALFNKNTNLVQHYSENYTKKHSNNAFAKMLLSAQKNVKTKEEKDSPRRRLYKSSPGQI